MPNISLPANRQSERLSAGLGRFLDGCLYAAVVLVPLFFLPLNQEALEINKQTLLIVLAGLCLAAWLGQGLAARRFTLGRQGLFIALGVFVLGYLVAALVSNDRYLSLVGNSGKTVWSFATVAALAALALVISHRANSLTRVYNLLFAFFLSSLLAAVFGLCQMFGWHLLPFGSASEAAFTTVGSTYGLAMFVVAPLVMASALALHGCRHKVCWLGHDSYLGKAARVLVWLTGVTSLALLVLVDLQSTWILLFLGIFLLLLISYWRSRQLGKPRYLVVPTALLVICLVFFFIKTPIKPGLPSEITPSFRASWNIAQQTLRAYPWFGSGPGTFIYDYALFRVPMVNQSPFWTVRFDRGYSSAVTLLATLGVIGLLLWLGLIIYVSILSWPQLTTEKRDDAWYALITVFVGFAATVLVAGVYNYNLAHHFTFWFLLGLLGALTLKRSWTIEPERQPAAWGGLTVAVTVAVIGILVAGGFAGQRWLADYQAARAAETSASSPGAALPLIEKAQSLNPYADEYARSLSQNHLVRALALVRNRSTSTQEIVGELSAAVDAGRRAVSQNPAEVDNWANLALV